MALVGISSVTSLVIGVVLYYFAQQRLLDVESDLLAQRSSTANTGARDFLESLRNPEDQTLPASDTYAKELVRSVSDPTGLGVLYIGPKGEPLAARDGFGNTLNPRRVYEQRGMSAQAVRKTMESADREGRLKYVGGQKYVAVWPLTGANGQARGVLVYSSSNDELRNTLAYLRYGILGAILTSIILAGLASFLLTRQIIRPLSQTRDAAIRVASGDYATTVPVTSGDELGEVARAFNYMAEEIEHYVGQIQEQKSRLEAVLDASPEAIIVTDPQERVTLTNPAAARMLGIRPSDNGQKLAELGTPAEIIQCLREAAKTTVAIRELESGDKTYWTYAARMSPEPPVESTGESNGSVDSLNGNNAGTIVAVRDITEYRSLERSKTAFVSDVSHELRTPLTTIQSAVDLLDRARGKLDPLEHRALELADQELKRIRGMVEELLTLAQMDSWQYSLELGPTNLSEVIQNAVDSVESKAERFGIEIIFHDDSEHRCICDPQKLYQVFLNLLDNAIKYSDPGSHAGVTIEEDESDLIVRIRDTGVGIPPEDLEQLFERFYRVNKDRSRATGGSGLGLSISRQIVEMHGGNVSVQSEVGEGSTFTVSLPKSPLPRSANHAM